MKKVGIVICNYNKADMVKNCIQAVLENRFRDYDVFVVDNASTDASVSVIEKTYLDTNSESYDEMIKKFMESDIVLFDDIGAENLTAWSRDEVLGTILQYRMEESLPTFFTSNLNIEELESHLAETKQSVDLVKAKRIIERIKSLTDDIELISKNRRV
jgi:DNA replication protein DnaC